jgi:hypothetical protein
VDLAGGVAVQRNPLLIPGIIFGVVCALLLGAVVAYAVTSGDDQPASSAAASPSPSPSPAPPKATTAASASASSATSASTSAAASTSASASAGPSPSAGPASCVLGVWLEERHDEQVTVINTGVFPFHGSGVYQRYS